MIIGKTYTCLDNELILYPYGTYMWNKIVSYLKEKLYKLNYQEVYSSSLLNLIKRENKDRVKYFSLCYSSNNIELITYSKSLDKVEARNDSIDLIEVYNLLGKELLGVPFISGKEPLNENSNIITTLLGHIVARTSYLGQIDNYHYSNSSINVNVLHTIFNMLKDRDGMIISPKISPIQMMIFPIKSNEKGVMKTCKELKNKLIVNGYQCEISQTTNRNEHINNGVPFILQVGPRDVEKKEIEIIIRDNLQEILLLNDESLCSKLDEQINKMHKKVYLRNLELLIENQEDVIDLKTLHKIESRKISKVMWCGSRECLKSIKEETILISFNQCSHSEKCLFCSEKGKHSISFIKKI